MVALIPVPGNIIFPVTGLKFAVTFVAGVLTIHSVVALSRTVIVPAATPVGTTHESPKILVAPLLTVVVVAVVILAVFISTGYHIILSLSVSSRRSSHYFIYYAAQANVPVTANGSRARSNAKCHVPVVIQVKYK